MKVGITKEWRDAEPYEEETISMSRNKLSISVNTISGKDAGFYVIIAPSLNVSGYGKTFEEAKESFDENIIVFGEDLNTLSLRERFEYLKSLGWTKSKYFKKRLSKAFVDHNGVLQNLEEASLQPLEMAV